MNEELLLTALNLFDTSEKWVAFCDLMNRNGEIQNRWWKKLQTEVYQREIREANPDWDIYIWDNWDIMWYIKGAKINTLAVHFWGDTFRVFYDFGDLDTNKVNMLIKDPKFNIIKTSFERLDGSDSKTIGWEHRNFHFGTAYDGRFPDHRTLSWFAGNETEKFADQLIRKVRKFQTSEITKLFKEVNEKCLKE